eukprot:TRINITY_DN66118_c0_g1_i1.p1 TRINITY_DN66118_c0_g1~~TRINITY_DN66118_c0_g1_i1.p1  ORF type:complete len:510 (-),score=89.36 TRINITY_DN66118_c0_g1_i1:2-1507(-)
MLLSQPLRTAKKAAEKVPALIGEVVRIRLLSGQHDLGWFLDAQRVLREDQRDETSTFVSAHRPGLDNWAGEWCLEAGSREGQFCIRLASSQLSQPAGWYLDVARKNQSDFRSEHSGFAVVRKLGRDCIRPEWTIEHDGAFQESGHRCSIKLVAGECREAHGWYLHLARSLPEDQRTEDSTFVSALEQPSKPALWLLEAVAEAPAAKEPQRFYEVVVRNLGERPLQLQGPKGLARRAAAGRFLHLTGELPPAEGSQSSSLPKSVRPVLAPDPESNPPATVQAKFSSRAALGDLLEFSVTYVDSQGNGVTVRAHANAASSLRSSAQVHGQELEAVSAVEEVPRLVVRPPLGYAETALGVYSKPGRCAALQVGELKAEDEVVSGHGPRDGRWMKISHPVEGWVQAETRDGRPLLHEFIGTRPNLRQVVTLRPVKSNQCGRTLSQPLSARLPCTEAKACQERSDAEKTYFSVRAAEASRLHRERALLESSGLKGYRVRQSILGVF